MHGVLGEAGDAVRGVGQPQAVPMEGGRFGQIVDQRDLDAVALGDAQLGAGDGATVRPDGLAIDLGFSSGQGEGVDGLGAWSFDQGG